MPSASTMLIVRSITLLACLVLIPAMALLGVSVSSFFEVGSAASPRGRSAVASSGGERELDELQQLAGMSSSDHSSPEITPPGNSVSIPTKTVPAFWGGGGDERSYWEQHAVASGSHSASPIGTSQVAPSDAVAHLTSPAAEVRAKSALNADIRANGGRRVPWLAQTKAELNTDAISTTSMAPEREGVIAAGPMPPADDDATARPVSPERVTESSRQDAMQSLIAKLQSMGAAYFRLETWGNVSEFRCEMPLPESPRYHAFFEATDPDPLRAMEQVLHKIEIWQVQRRQSTTVATPPSPALPGLRR